MEFKNGESLFETLKNVSDIYNPFTEEYFAYFGDNFIKVYECVNKEMALQLIKYTKSYKDRWDDTLKWFGTAYGVCSKKEIIERFNDSRKDGWLIADYKTVIQ